jgi:hypothetical protein
MECKLDEAEETMRGVVRAIEEEPDADKARAIVTLTELWLSAGDGFEAAVDDLDKALARADDDVAEAEHLFELAGRSVELAAEYRMRCHRFAGVLNHNII